MSDDLSGFGMVQTVARLQEERDINSELMLKMAENLRAARQDAERLADLTRESRAVFRQCEGIIAPLSNGDLINRLTAALKAHEAKT